MDLCAVVDSVSELMLACQLASQAVGSLLQLRGLGSVLRNFIYKCQW